MKTFQRLETELSGCYRVLDISPEMGWEEIRKTYRTLAKRFHPDRHAGNLACEARLKEINRAFTLLQSHHRPRSSLANKNPVQAPARSSIFRPVVRAQPEYTDAMTPAASVLQNSSEVSLGAWLKKQFLQVERILFMPDLTQQVSISPRTAKIGGKIRIRRGADNFYVDIPSGGWKSLSLRLPGKGEFGLLGKSRGDLVLQIQVQVAHPVASGESVFYYDMVLKRKSVGTGRVQTLDSMEGPIKFFLPRNVKNGQRFTLKAQPQSREHGKTASHVVTIQIA
jgi:DnaJ-class molecular chaperone